MTTSGSRLPLTATHGGAGKGAFAHMSRDESQAIIQPWILDPSAKVSRLVALLGASSSHPAPCSEDRAAFVWIQRFLEEIDSPSSGGDLFP